MESGLFKNLDMDGAPPLIYCKYLICTVKSETVEAISEHSMIKRLFYDDQEKPYCIFEIPKYGYSSCGMICNRQPDSIDAYWENSLAPEV